MLKEAIAKHIDKLMLQLSGDEDMIVKQLLVDATLIACRIQEERAETHSRRKHCNDN